MCLNPFNAGAWKITLKVGRGGLDNRQDSSKLQMNDAS